MINGAVIFEELHQNIWDECEKSSLINNILDNKYSHSKNFTNSEYLQIMLR